MNTVILAILLNQLWDGTGRVIPNAIVIVEGNTIARVATKTSEIPNNAKRIDLRKLNGLPGLIDAHTHITYFWEPKLGDNPRRPRIHPMAQVHLAGENARKTLATGVTTVRNLNASADIDIAVRDLIDKGYLKGPRIFTSGQGVFAGSDIRKTTAERIKAGHDWIKVFASTGGFDNVTGTQTLTYEQIKEAVDAAHAAGKRAAVHSYGPGGVRDAIRAGADSIEHGADLDDETLRRMAEAKITWVPTIDHNRYYIDAKDEFRFPAEAIPQLRSYIERNLDATRRAHRFGVKLAMGSDAVFTMFGQNTRELEWFIKAGLTPVEALYTATANAAALLGQQDKLGKVAKGFYADIIAVEGEPWKDINAIFKVKWVMKNGAIVSSP